MQILVLNMSIDTTDNDNFAAPGAVTITAAALQLARDFSRVACRGDNYVVAFDWAESIALRREPGGPLENIGACLMLGAYERVAVPRAFIQIVEGCEYAVRIPSDVLRASERRLIDADPMAPFKLALR
jgi:hypothetical protein